MTIDKSLGFYTFGQVQTLFYPISVIQSDLTPLLCIGVQIYGIRMDPICFKPRQRAAVLILDYGTPLLSYYAANALYGVVISIYLVIKSIYCVVISICDMAISIYDVVM